MAFLEIKKVNKTFKDGFQVLRDINFTLEKGEVLSIIGSSGSGKTTLLRCLNFLTTPDTGVYTLNGEDIYSADQKYSDEQLRQKRLRFGMVFQSFNLFPQYTALKNVSLALDLQKIEQAKKEKKKVNKAEIEKENAEIAKSLLEGVGLGDKISHYPCELSGGQQQRVAIARALALSPDVLCFDEPTSALDPELTGEVLKVIKGLKSKDRTMIIVTHEMDFAKNVSDKVIFMSDGEITEMGSAVEVFTNPQNPKTISFLNKSKESI